MVHSSINIGFSHIEFNSNEHLLLIVCCRQNLLAASTSRKAAKKKKKKAEKMTAEATGDDAEEAETADAEP